jgi:hypothetical protein
MSVKFDRMILGDEPILTQDSANIDIARMFNWYSHFYDQDKGKEVLTKYLNTGSYPSNTSMLVSKLKYVPMHLCAIARQLSIKSRLPADLHFKLKTFLDSLKAPEKQESQKDRAAEKISDMIALIEDQLDCFYLNKKFESAYNLLTENGARANVAGAVAAYYSPLLEEYKAAVIDREGYSKLTKNQLNKRIEFVQAIIDDCNSIIMNVKQQRKPRKAKVSKKKPLTNKMKYLPELPELKIVSIKPEAIIGSSEVWLYNHKYRTITRLVADADSTLSVKGTTILGFGALSQAKRIRKPAQVVSQVLNGNKVSLRKILDQLTTKSIAAKGRTSEETVILKAVK